MFDLAHDIRSAVRSLRRRPFAAVVTAATLALGLSACIAVFTYLNGFYQPFPGVDATGLFRVFGVEDDSPYQDISYLDFVDYSAAGGAFEGIAAAQANYAASVRHEDFTEVAFVEAVSGDYFSVLDIDMRIGRGLTPADDDPEATPAAVIAHSWWQASFGGEESVIGQTIFLNYRPYIVVGVTSPDFVGATASLRPHVWVPFAPFRDRYTSWSAMAEDRDIRLVRVYGRLGDGESRDRGLAELQAIASGLDEAYPRQESTRRLRVDAATWIDPRSRLSEMPTVRIMMGAAVGLLVLVCANVANLLLSMAAGRRREIAMRAALGAPPGRLLRQVLIENLLLSLLGGSVALLLAAPAASRLGSYFARPSVWGANVSRVATLDSRVIGFALLVSLLTGLLAGLLPALRATRRDVLTTLKTDSAGSIGAARRLLGRRVPGLHDLLISAQVALSVILIVVAGLLLRTLGSVNDIDPGFAYERMVASYVSTSSTSVEVEGREQWFRELAERLAEEPWVGATAIADAAILSPHGRSRLRLEADSDPVGVVVSRVNPGYFDTLEIDVLQGRGFLVTDIAEAPDVAIVNEALESRYFEGGQAVGRRIVSPGRDGAEDRSFEVVGVVSNARSRDFVTEPEPMVYFSYPQQGYPSGSALMVATTGDPEAAIPRLYAWLREFEPHIAIVNALPYTEVVRGFTYTQRMNAELFSLLAFLGLGLAAVGIFSVMSLAVSRRQREIGLRLAIGAARGDIGRLVIGRAMSPVALGLLLGLAASFGLTRLVQGMLHGVAPTDPLTIAFGTGVLVIAALSATWLPAHRAATVDPVIALRRE